MGSNTELKNQRKSLSLNVYILAFSNILCWAPISILGYFLLFALVEFLLIVNQLKIEIGINSIISNVTMSDGVYIAIVGLLIPLNSLINPYIYSLNEMTMFIRNTLKKVREFG